MLAVSVDDTAQTALELIRSSKLTGNIFYCYVTDKEGKLAGVVPIRKLITAHKETEISDIMVRNPIRLTADSSADTALEYFVFYKFMYDSIVGSRNDFFPNGLLPNNNLAHRLLVIFLRQVKLLVQIVPGKPFVGYSSRKISSSMNGYT
ncbi:MAG: magnesium transporter [Planctomycetota bacterium]|jgi:magnesium transporter|nr:magnesium transporter [Planctomycetota bacterium]